MGNKTIAKNRKAHFNYIILEKMEAGIQLLGTEVKSLRDGKCSLAEGYVDIRNGEAFLKNVNIPEYKHGNINNHHPKRERKLLLHTKEINKITKLINEKGITVVPLSMYLKQSLIKVEIGICKGKKLYDKREKLKERDDKRKIEREMRNKY